MASANVVQTSVSGGNQNALALQGDGVFFPKVSTASRLALALGTSDSGFIVYDTQVGNLFFWTGTAWTGVPTSGSPGLNQQVQYNNNGVVQGATGFTFDNATNAVAMSGDLTVRTTGLVVGSTATGIGTTPNTWSGAWKAAQVGRLTLGNATTDSLIGHNFYNDGSYRFAANDFASYYDQVGGAHIWGSSVTSGTAGNVIGWTVLATLNSTGLGIGTNVLGGNKLAIGSTSDTSATTNAINIVTNRATITTTCNGAVDAAGTTINYSWANGGQGPLIFRNAAISNVMTLDASGNCGIAVTPSAWATSGGYRALQIGGVGIYGRNTASNELVLSSNAYFDTTDSRWEYITTAAATRYDQQYGAHQWFTAASGTLNTAISFTQAMTLTAAGELLVTKTTPNATVVGVQATSTGEFSSTMASAVSAQSTLNVYSTGAAAYRFYVGMNGTINATNTTISAISDARLKENVQDIDVGLGAILALKPRKFDWKAGKGKDIKGDRGFIAQEFEQVFPQLVDEWKDEAPEGEAPYKSVRQDLIPVLVKAIQELTARVVSLEAR